jgi:hypothetical protein
VPLVFQELPVKLTESAHWAQVAVALLPEALLQLPALPVSLLQPLAFQAPALEAQA